MRELLHHGELVGYCVDCPGCATLKKWSKHWMAQHTFYIRPLNGREKSTPVWKFDGNLRKPTFSPSLKMETDYYFDGKTPQKVVCHFFLRAGIFEYLDDCTHELAGQKVPMSMEDPDA